MRVKTQDLIGPQLDWAVAKCEGYIDNPDSWLYHAKSTGINNYRPSSNWGLGGPIIEREWIELLNGSNLHPHLWGATKHNEDVNPVDAGGPTPLFAAMRCYVTSKLGDEVDVP